MQQGTLILRVVLIGWGALLLVFGACQLAVPHARYVSSSPAPGGSLPSPPAAIVVRFSQELDPTSTITVQRTLDIDGARDTAGMLAVGASALDREDPTRRTLRAESLPMLGGGTYRVDWRVVTAGRRRSGYGSFYFGIGTPVPRHLVGPVAIQGRDVRARGYRAAALGGLIFLALAALVTRRRLPG